MRSHHGIGHQLSTLSTLRHPKLMTNDPHDDNRGSGRLKPAPKLLAGSGADLLPPKHSRQRLGDFQSCQILNLNSHLSKQS
jgi:hypothetical protein